MFDRLKQVLVESFVGAIALGWLLAQGIVHFVYIFAAPVSGWLSRKEYGGLAPHGVGLPGFSWQDAEPELIRAFGLLVIWYLLLRWLYFRPNRKETVE